MPTPKQRSHLANPFMTGVAHVLKTGRENEIHCSEYFMDTSRPREAHENGASTRACSTSHGVIGSISGETLKLAQTKSNTRNHEQIEYWPAPKRRVCFDFGWQTKKMDGSARISPLGNLSRQRRAGGSNRFMPRQTSGWFGQIIAALDDAQNLTPPGSNPEDLKSPGMFSPRAESNKFVLRRTSALTKCTNGHANIPGKSNHLAPSNLPTIPTRLRRAEERRFFKKPSMGARRGRNSRLARLQKSLAPGRGRHAVHTISFGTRQCEPEFFCRNLGGGGAFRSEDVGQTEAD